MRAHSHDLTLISCRTECWSWRRHGRLMQVSCLCPDRTVTARWPVAVCPSTTPMCCRCCSSAIVKANRLQPPSAGQLWKCCSFSPSTSKGGKARFTLSFHGTRVQREAPLAQHWCLLGIWRSFAPAGFSLLKARGTQCWQVGCLHGFVLHRADPKLLRGSLGTAVTEEKQL